MSYATAGLRGVFTSFGIGACLRRPDRVTPPKEQDDAHTIITLAGMAIGFTTEAIASIGNMSATGLQLSSLTGALAGLYILYENNPEQGQPLRTTAERRNMLITSSAIGLLAPVLLVLSLRMMADTQEPSMPQEPSCSQ